MPRERVTVSLDADAAAALDDLVDRTGSARSEVVRRALTFYAANFEAASDDEALAEYHRMLSGGEHVLLDVDFLHCFLDRLDPDDPDDEFVDCVDRVSEYHAHEYAERFDGVGELLDWLSLCGFLTVRDAGEDVYHVVFPSAAMRRFMTRFLRKSTAELPIEVELEESVAKVLVRER